jgi:hypothetical protein
MRILALLLVAACSSDTSPPPPPAAPKPESLLTGRREHGMRHCPSSVPGSMTRSVATKDGVDVFVTAGDPAAQRQILALAQTHTRIANPSGLPTHDGNHNGPGTIGYCPIIHANTLVTVDDAPGGAVIHVTTADKTQREALRKATADRVAQLNLIPTS